MQNKKNVRSNLPAGHFSQELLPSKTLYSPTSQALHSCVPGTWAYLPFGHMEQAVEALWEDCPGGQSVQLEAMVETENLPLLQSRHSGRPGFGAFLPGTQSRQSSKEVPPSLFKCFPQGHRMQPFDPVKVTYFPLGQASHVDAAVVEENFPNPHSVVLEFFSS